MSFFLEVKDFEHIAKNFHSPMLYEEFDSVLSRTYRDRYFRQALIKFSISVNFLYSSKKYLSLNDEFKTSKNNLEDKLINLIFKSSIDFESIFNNKFMIYDTQVKSYFIRKSAFDVNSIELQSILESAGFLKRIKKDESVLFLINSNYLSLLKKITIAQKQKEISPDKLEELLQLKNKYGLEAEEFVLDFEKKRLNKKNIEWVASVIVNAGYDIASFNDEYDESYSRFIEVKSFEGPNEYFYLSQNEMSVSKIKKEQYWIYLVDRRLINSHGYAPKMIQNPVENIFNNAHWSSEVQNWKFYKS